DGIRDKLVTGVQTCALPIYPNWNRPQTYSVTLIRHGKGAKPKQEVLGENIPTPPDNVGPRSTPSYDSLASAAVTDLPGGIKVFEIGRASCRERWEMGGVAVG